MKNLNEFEIIILKYLQLAGRGVTTRRVAEKTQMSWVTAQKYLKWMFKDSLVDIYRDNGKIKWRIREELLDMPTWEETLDTINKLKKLKIK